MVNAFHLPNPVKDGEVRGKLAQRAQLFQQLRAFFYARDVIEVDTPALSQAATPDVHLDSLRCSVRLPGYADAQPYFLHTSPEYPMKRLLCAGSGDIFYLGKVFRDGDVSPRHQVEFTMLEWYRLGFSLADLMQETADLIQAVLRAFQPDYLGEVQWLTYQQAFAQYAGIDDIFTASAQQCRDCLAAHGVAEIVGVDAGDKPLWEQLVLTEVIEAQLGQAGPTCLSHYPAREAALAQISKTDPRVALRFEVFVKGVELANGYQELEEADLYQQRFTDSNALRQTQQKSPMPADQHLLTALAQQGLPECSGVALGVDRLLMLALQKQQLTDVVPFGIEQA